MDNADFVVVGSSGGGGTIAWLLAKAGFKVVVLEVGTDWAKPLDDEKPKYNPTSHDEYRYRVARPEWKRRPRGDYNTSRTDASVVEAEPFGAGWSASMLGGGSVIWGAWAFRALPIDFRLGTFFEKTHQAKQLRAAGYDVADWPVPYRDMMPFFNVSETLLAVCGDRDAINKSIAESPWYADVRKILKDDDREWFPKFKFPSDPFPETPVGRAVKLGFDKTKCTSAPLPSAMVAPGSGTYATRQKIADALKAWDGNKRPEFWKQAADQIWSERVRDACNMCGYCGEYLCWGKNGPKSGTRASTLIELRDLPNAEVITDARAYEVVYDERIRRASGVRYLDVRDPDKPIARFQRGRFIIVSCGAVQSARLLLMSGPPAGLGNSHDQLGRNVMFHLFGLSASCTLPEKFQGTLRGELGHTGNVTTFEHYFLKDENDTWCKGGTLVSTAKKNPLENAITFIDRSPTAGSADLLARMEGYNRSMELRITGDDLPMPANRVDLDPRHVDEYGFPVARITRKFGDAEKRMFRLAEAPMTAVFERYKKIGATVKFDEGNLRLIGDHQMGTCRMGDDPARSVVDHNCRLHDAPNVFVVDSSFMPTGFGLNPMVTVVANALRVGTWIVQEASKGDQLEADPVSQ
ncbi:MAG: GMC family oxidoreductase [Acidobacteriota bacterium]